MAQGVRVVGRKAWEREVVEAQLCSFIMPMDMFDLFVCERWLQSRLSESSTTNQRTRIIFAASYPNLCAVCSKQAS